MALQPTPYFGVYSRENSPHLTLIMDIRAISAKAALEFFKTQYGDNYGKVVVLPLLSTMQDHSFQ